MNVFLSRLVAAILAPLLVYLSTRFPFLREFLADPDNVSAIVSYIVGVVLLIYGLVHRLLDKKFNPADVAKSPEVAAHRAGIE